MPRFVLPASNTTRPARPASRAVRLSRFGASPVPSFTTLANTPKFSAANRSCTVFSVSVAETSSVTSNEPSIDLPVSAVPSSRRSLPADPSESSAVSLSAPPAVSVSSSPSPLALMPARTPMPPALILSITSPSRTSSPVSLTSEVLPLLSVSRIVPADTPRPPL